MEVRSLFSFFICIFLKFVPRKLRIENLYYCGNGGWRCIGKIFDRWACNANDVNDENGPPFSEYSEPRINFLHPQRCVHNA